MYNKEFHIFYCIYGFAFYFTATQFSISSPWRSVLKRIQLKTLKGSMIHSKDIKARLFFTYLKDKTELFLYVNPRGTTGSEMMFRRAPGDAAMNLRIQTLLDNAEVQRFNTEIWILLY
ncbi:hypothetical protein HQ531_02790, partial [bacterium]|nr:hypothetical protein [bacterium]